jgi:hypothetical protein
MPTDRQTKTPSNIAPTLESNFQSEWEQANNDYASAIKAGFTPEDSQRLYLEPVTQKWSIVASSPGLQQDKKRFNTFNTEFNDAQDNYHKNFFSFSRDGGEWAANQPGSIAPTLRKWAVESRLPIERQADPMLREKEGALQEAREGFDPQDIINGHPASIFADPAFLGRFNTATGEGYKSRQTEKRRETKAAAPADILKLGERRKSFQDLLTHGSATPGTINTNLPPALQSLYGSQISNLDEQLTNPPPVAPTIDLSNPPVRFQPSAGAQSPESTLQVNPQLSSGLRPNGGVVPKGAIDYLKSNPGTKADFDSKFGSGTADVILQQLGQQ